MEFEYEYEPVENTEEVEEMNPEVLDIFNQLREKPFRNATQRKEMVSLLSQLLVYDTPEVRRLYKEIGKLLNDLGDNGVIDNSASDLEESTGYKPYFESTAQKFGYSK